MNLIVRPLDAERDLPGLVELINDVRRGEGNPAEATAEQLAPQLAAPGFRRWVAAEGDDGPPVGLAVLFPQTPDRCYGDIRVRPAWRRRGVGRLLAEALVKGAAKAGAPYLAIDVAHDNRDALRFLLSQGFRFRGDVWALSLPADAPLAAVEWPEGYTVRSFTEVNDVDLFAALCNRTFGDLWGHWENTPGLVDAAHMAGRLAELDQNGVFVVFDALGDAVAQCRTKASVSGDLEGSPHLLDQPGVVPERRDAGLHAPLALEAARWLRRQGERPIRLESWGDAAATIAIYEALGFAVVEHEVSYVRELAR